MRRRAVPQNDSANLNTSWLGNLVGASIDWMGRRASAMVPEHAPEDLAHETIVRVLSSPARDAPRYPRAFLATVARNVAIDSARQLRVRGGPAVALDGLPESQTPSTAADQETTLLLKQVILGLPPLYRDVFVLNRFVGLTYQEIALKLGLSVKAVEYRMSRALALCEEALRN